MSWVLVLDQRREAEGTKCHQLMSEGGKGLAGNMRKDHSKNTDNPLLLLNIAAQPMDLLCKCKVDKSQHAQICW